MSQRAALRLGMMPATTVRRRISLFKRSWGLFDQICRQCGGGKAANARISAPASASKGDGAGDRSRCATHTYGQLDPLVDGVRAPGDSTDLRPMGRQPGPCDRIHGERESVRLL